VRISELFQRPIQRQFEFGADAGTTLRWISDWMFLI